jgi:hypothetical protein
MTEQDWDPDDEEVGGRNPTAVAKSKISLAPARWLERRLEYWDDARAPAAACASAKKEAKYE